MTKKEFQRFKVFIKEYGTNCKDFHGWIRTYNNLDGKFPMFVQFPRNLHVKKFINGDKILGINFKYVQKINLWIETYFNNVKYF